MIFYLDIIFMTLFLRRPADTVKEFLTVVSQVPQKQEGVEIRGIRGRKGKKQEKYI
jgi:hypothetical protein